MNNVGSLQMQCPFVDRHQDLALVNANAATVVARAGDCRPILYCVLSQCFIEAMPANS